MAGVNKVMLLGNLTRDPVVRQFPSGQGSVTDFGIAVTRKYTNSQNQLMEDTCFVDIAAYGRTGDVVAKFCHKGDPLFVEGRLKFDQWEDRNNPGQKRSRLTIVAESVQLMPGRRENTGAYPSGMQQNNAGGYGMPQYQQNAPQQPMPQFRNSAPGIPDAPMPAFQPMPPAPPVDIPSMDGAVPMDDVPF